MIKKDRIKMRELDPHKRVIPPLSFSEVALGYSEEEAISEAQRCIQCQRPQCVKGCPVEIDIPGFIKEIKNKNFISAINKIKEKNNLPAICGRVCPQETQCEKECILGKKGEPVAIGALERFSADIQIKNRKNFENKDIKKIGVKVAVVGSGPAGLTCAGDLAREGFDVTIYEALHKPGGVLRYGIPTFRLPRDVLDYEIDFIKSLGVEIKCDYVIGKILTIKEIFNLGYKAVFIGTGAGFPVFPNIPGQNLCGIYSANEFLTRVNLMSAYRFPEYDTPINIGRNIAIIGGGNTAMDSARCALRVLLSSGKSDIKVTIIYRRSENEMPARLAEIEHAKEEGINFLFLTQPLEFIGDNNFYVQGIKCVKCELGQPDSSGRRRPVPIKGSEFIIPADTVILAIGVNPNPIIVQSMPELRTGKWGDIEVNPETMETSVENVYAGGDIVGGEGTVIEAMGMGKLAGKAIIKKFKK